MAGECLAHLVQLEWFDDRDDEFHGQAFISRKDSLAYFYWVFVCRFGGPPGDLPFTQIWHLSGQMAQKSCRFKGKTFASGDLSHCTGNMILRHNAPFSPAD